MHNWPETVLTRKVKRQAKERVPTLTCPEYRFRLTCFLFCQNRMVIQTYLGGQKKKNHLSGFKSSTSAEGGMRQMWENIKLAAAETGVFLRT